MATRPTDKPKWASLLENDIITGAPNKEKPSEEYELSGQKRKQPILRSHFNWILDNLSKWVDYLDTVTNSIVEDETIYVSVTGSDIAGDGSILNPYSTPQKALESLQGRPIADDVTVTIHCFQGQYTLLTPILVDHPYRDRIVIMGDELLGVKPSGAPIADWSGDKTSPIVPSRGTNQFYNTAGTLSVLADTATRQAAIQSDLTNNKSLINSRYATVFNFVGCNGLVGSVGNIDNIALVGDWDGSFTAVHKDLKGVFNKGSSLLKFGPNVTIIGWDGDGVVLSNSSSSAAESSLNVINNHNNGFNIKNNSSLSGDSINTLGNGANGMYTSNNGSFSTEDTLSSGNLLDGLSAFNNSSSVVDTNISCGNGGNGITLGLKSSSELIGSVFKGNAKDGKLIEDGSTCVDNASSSRDNAGMGMNALNAAGAFDETNTLYENNSYGVRLEDGSTGKGSNVTIINNTDGDILADKNCYMSLTSPNMLSGGTVTATKRTYINMDSIAGVTFTPTYGSAGADGSLIDN